MAGIAGLGNGSYKSIHSRGSMNSMSVSINSGIIQTGSSVSRHGSVRTLIGRRLNKNGVGSNFISKDEMENTNSTNNLQLMIPGTFPSKPSSPLLPLLSHGRPITPEGGLYSSIGMKRMSSHLSRPSSGTPQTPPSHSSRPLSGSQHLSSINLKSPSSHRLISRKSMRKNQLRLKAAKNSLEMVSSTEMEVVPTGLTIKQLSPSQLAFLLLSNVVPDSHVPISSPLSKLG